MLEVPLALPGLQMRPRGISEARVDLFALRITNRFYAAFGLSQARGPRSAPEAERDAQISSPTHIRKAAAIFVENQCVRSQ
jgi:hypothetical protein